jgi:DTW domain-containing protein YfiP
MEYKKEKNATGRLSHLCLENSQIITGIDFNQNEAVQTLLNDENNFCTLLYPGIESRDISQGDFRSKSEQNKKWIVFILDATWPCAKKMMKLSTCLHFIPKISFSNGRKSIFTIKHQPNEMCLSTIESVHQFLIDTEMVGLEKIGEAKDNLMEVFKAMIDFQIKCASDPTIPSYKKFKKAYKTPEQRAVSQKWLHRKIIFEPSPNSI